MLLDSNSDAADSRSKERLIKSITAEKYVSPQCSSCVARGWERKRAWYENNGFKIGENLFTTQEDERGGLDSGPIQETAERIRKLL